MMYVTNISDEFREKIIGTPNQQTSAKQEVDGMT